MKTWVLLKGYRSQSEARVVESFLTANGVEVQVLDQHTYGMLPTKALGSAGMRLMVGEEDLARALELLARAEAGAHLSIAEDSPEGVPPSTFGRTDRIVSLLLVIFVVVVWLVLHFQSSAP